jgi:hypothetical protein
MAALHHGKGHSYNQIHRLGGTAGLEAVENTKAYYPFWECTPHSSVSQYSVSQYTNYAIPAPEEYSKRL